MRLTNATHFLIAAASVSIAWYVTHVAAVETDKAETPSVNPSTHALVSQNNETQQPNTDRPTPNGPFRGMAIQLHAGANVYDEYKSLIPEVADLGADTVLLVVHGWQTHAGTLDLHFSPQRTPSIEGVGKLLDLAAMHGLRRILMPVVLLKNPRNGEWRGKIVPPGHDWDAWFKRYRQFLNIWADLAEKHKVEVFMVGSELIKTEAYTDRWREVIRDVRQHYRGKLGYSSNWDHYQTSKIGFWGDLDFVGMTTYYKLAKQPNPDIAEIDANWARIKREILTFQESVSKPILFTEVGWCSQEGAAKEGWNYYGNQNATDAGRREQAILYESFMKAWTHEPSVGGIIWWEWDRSAGGNDDYGYTPRGKLAEAILRMWFANLRDVDANQSSNGEGSTRSNFGVTNMSESKSGQ